MDGLVWAARVFRSLYALSYPGYVMASRHSFSCPPFLLFRYLKGFSGRLIVLSSR